MPETELMQIESLISTHNGAVVMVRRSKKGPFRISGRSVLAGATLKPVLKMPGTNAQGTNQEFALFELQLLQPEDLRNFSIGEEVLFEESEQAGGAGYSRSSAGGVASPFVGEHEAPPEPVG